MSETKTNAPTCKTVTCKKELTYLEDTNCWRCLICNPLPKNVTPEPEKEDRSVDVRLDKKQTIALIDKMVREIVRDELENWHIQEPSVTREEVTEILDIPNWREEAKELGVELYNHEMKCPRKKVDVLVEIERKKDEQVQKENQSDSDQGGSVKDNADSGGESK